MRLWRVTTCAVAVISANCASQAHAGEACDYGVLLLPYQTLHAFVSEVQRWASNTSSSSIYGWEPSVTERLAIAERGRHATMLLEIVEALRLHVCSTGCNERLCGFQVGFDAARWLDRTGMTAIIQKSGLHVRHQVLHFAALDEVAAHYALAAASVFNLGTFPVVGQLDKCMGDKYLETEVHLWNTFAAMRSFWGVYEKEYAARLAFNPVPSALTSLLWPGRDLESVLRSLDGWSNRLSQPSDLPAFQVCGALPATSLPHMDSAQIWGATRFQSASLTVRQLLADSERSGGSLAYLIISIRPPVDVFRESCEAGDRITTDVTMCLEAEGGWGVLVDYDYPDGRIAKDVLWKAMRGSAVMPTTLPAKSASLHSLPTPFVDLFRLSPFAGNCAYLDGLLFTKGSQVLPRVVIVPINPLVPPPFDVVPDFTKFVTEYKGLNYSAFSSSAVYGQCSLVAVWRILRRHHPYHLVRLETTAPYAYFVHQNFLSREVAESGEQCHDNADISNDSWSCSWQRLFELWADGWLCTAEARYANLLEAFPSAKSWLDLADLQITSWEKTSRLCETFESLHIPIKSANFVCPSTQHPMSPPLQSAPALSGMLAVVQFRACPATVINIQRSGHGHCLPNLGICECFPPWRGRYCDIEDKGHGLQKPFNAAFVTVLPDREHYIADFVSNLLLLWQRFNSVHDYPILVFTEGLDRDTKRRLVRASPCRLWFYMLEDLLNVPGAIRSDARQEAVLQQSSHNHLGYRGQARWKAGPMFHHPVFSGDEQNESGRIQYIWWIDYDSYLPASQLSDPISFMHENGLIFAWTHWGHDARASSRNFWEFTRLYMHSLDITVESTELLAAVHDLEEGSFRGRLFMNDCELMRVDWFRMGPYQEYFRYMDNLHGIWLHRWGDHLIRTFGVAMFTLSGQATQINLPYAHQDVCLCGTEKPDLKCSRIADPSRLNKGWRWVCIPPEADS